MTVAMEARKVGEEGEVSLTHAQVHTWPTWRGSAHAPTRRSLRMTSPAAASQHREHPSRMLPPVPSSHRNHHNSAPQVSRVSPVKHRARRRPEPAEPEPEMARDLLGEEATTKSSWRRGYRVLRRTICPRWRRRRSSEAAGVAGRWRWRLGFARGTHEREGCE
jgi:hypothetical protein